MQLDDIAEFLEKMRVKSINSPKSLGMGGNYGDDLGVGVDALRCLKILESGAAMKSNCPELRW